MLNESGLENPILRPIIKRNVASSRAIRLDDRIRLIPGRARDGHPVSHPPGRDRPVAQDPLRIDVARCCVPVAVILPHYENSAGPIRHKPANFLGSRSGADRKSIYRPACGDLPGCSDSLQIDVVIGYARVLVIPPSDEGPIPSIRNHKWEITETPVGADGHSIGTPVIAV